MIQDAFGRPISVLIGLNKLLAVLSTIHTKLVFFPGACWSGANANKKGRHPYLVNIQESLHDTSLTARLIKQSVNGTHLKPGGGGGGADEGGGGFFPTSRISGG